MAFFALLAYTKQVQPWYPTWELPLPFVYLSNGKEIAFKDCRQVDAKYEIVQKFMRPWDLVRQLNLGEFDGLPYLLQKAFARVRFYRTLPNNVSLSQKPRDFASSRCASTATSRSMRSM